MERPQHDRLEIVKHLFLMRFEGEVTHTETGEQFNVQGPSFKRIDDIDVSGVYEHYKSTPENKKQYYVDSVHCHEKSREYLVVYTPLHTVAGFEVYARPIDMFLGIVDVEGKPTTRFRRLETRVK